MAVTGDAQTGQFATASTDTGHPSSGTANGQGGANAAQAGGGFALDPATHTLNEGLITDFASRSLHEMTVKAKAVIKAYYGHPPKYSYWNGCSTGGRQGWMEAQRFPDDYDARSTVTRMMPRTSRAACGMRVNVLMGTATIGIGR